MTDSTAFKSSEPAANEDNVERIRDLLFGAQIKDYERRFLELEQRFSAETERNRSELSERLHQLETFMASELSRLGESIRQERQEREEALERLNQRVTDMNAALGAQLREFNELGEQERLALRNECLERFQSATDQIRERSSELRGEMQSEAQRLQSEKTGREELSRLMTEIALRLSGDFKLPMD